MRKIDDITIYDTPIERVDSFCYLGIVFRYNNTFQNAIKHNIDKARKAVFKISVLLNEIDLDVKTRIHLFDTLILPILLYGCEIWGFENVEQIEVFRRKYLRYILQVRKSTPNAMVYGELGRYELRYMIWQRMANFWKSIARENGNYSNVIYGAIVENNFENKWLISIKNILINCGIPRANEYANFINDGEFRNFVKRCCLDLAIQSWHVKIRTSSLCETYSTFKHQLKLESYLHCLKPREGTQLSTFKCAPSFLPNVRNKIANETSLVCPFCGLKCNPDEYHLLLTCNEFSEKREELLPEFLYEYPNVIKFDQLMNSTNNTQLRNLASLCEFIRTICCAKFDM